MEKHPSYEEWLKTYAPMAGGDPEGDPAPAPVVEPPAPTPAPAVPAAPWSADLAATFQDEPTRAAVDTFMRERYQPYVTQLEQGRSQAEPAISLYSDLQNDPVSTYIGITQELYGDEAAQAIASILEQQLNPQPTSATPEPAAPAALPAEAQEAIQWIQDQRNAQLYTAEIDRVKEAATQGDAPIQVVDKLFHPFVVAAEGDFDRALEGYRNFYGEAKAIFAPSDPTLQVPDAPATLGLPSAPAVTAPPTMKEYKGWSSIDEALSDTLAEMKSAAAPPALGT